MIAIFTGVPYLFSLASGLCLEVNDIITSHRVVEVDGHLDLVVANPLPTTKQYGGPRKIVLGASPNPRIGPWWKLFWSITLILQTMAIILLYVFLGREKTQTVFIWAGFQLFWVATRLLIFNLTDYARPMADLPMKSSSLGSLSLTMKLRVMNLVLGVGSYQAHAHPRTIEAYLDDSFSTRQIARLLAPGNIFEVYPVPSAGSSSSLSVRSEDSVGPGVTTKTVQVNIIAVVGDTALSSAAWMLGKSEYNSMDLYDSCIVILEIPNLSVSVTTSSRSPIHPPSKIVAIPSARVTSGRSSWLDVMAAGDEEPLFVARGAAIDHAYENTWIYWVPCEDGQWLQIKGNPTISLGSSSLSKTSVNTSPSFKSGLAPGLGNASPAKIHSVLGRRTAEVVDDNQLTRTLGTGRLNISLKDVQEVRSVVELSRRATEALLEFLK